MRLSIWIRRWLFEKMDYNYSRKFESFLEREIEKWKNVDDGEAAKIRFRAHYLLAKLNLREWWWWGDRRNVVYHFCMAQDELRGLWDAGEYLSVLKFEKKLDDLEFFFEAEIVA